MSETNDEFGQTRGHPPAQGRGFSRLDVKPSPPCTMGVGCYEAGVCFAEAHGEPDRCPLSAPRLEARFVICHDCGGEGIWDVPTGGYDPRDGGLLTETRCCSTCGGSGQVEEEPEPRTENDLDRDYPPFIPQDGNEP